MKRDAPLRHGAAATRLNQQPHQLAGQEGGDSGAILEDRSLLEYLREKAAQTLGLPTRTQRKGDAFEAMVVYLFPKDKLCHRLRKQAHMQLVFV